uniref:3-oxo-5-alpha-steroid 4-dehydrogenase family protein n=1 Tax=Babesia bovis TaxID=5865 RepID=A7AMG6_BABBO|eukprot:XP_001611318.1 3-oxo-5-alpha-steroid 4-dehydrogenase family protein [Babesia bovis T2Bo]
MNILLKQSNGAFIERISIADDATVDDLRQLFYEKSDGVKLVENRLSDYGITDDTSLYFKDLGVQISWRLVFFLEYLGPLLILPLLYHFPGIFYRTNDVPKNNVQVFTFVMLMFHFTKRELESLFVHRFSRSTMPIRNLFINCFHYWILCAVGIGYFVFHPRYTEIILLWRYEKIVLIILFFYFQFMTLMTHLTLRNLRPKGTRVRGIPNNWGFQYVSCANYFWELMIWVVVALFTNTISSYIFVFAVGAILSQWAMSKHRKYIKEFSHYDRRRRALIPFIY